MGMSILQIRYYGDPILEKPAKEMDLSTLDQYKTFFDDFIETMYKKDGVGLAGPQVGFPYRIVCVDPSRGQDSKQLLVLINPRIVRITDSSLTQKIEGCLSFPDIDATIPRYEGISVKAYSIKGHQIEIDATGYLARILQHEIDHLDGIMLPNRMDPLERNLLSGKLKKLRKETISNLKKKR